MIKQSGVCDERVLHWLRREDTGSNLAVEFGAGMCAYTPHILSRNVVAVEQFKEMLDLCDSPSVIRVVGDMLKWRDLNLGPFDTAVFIDSLEHVGMADGLAMLSELQDSPFVKRILIFAPMGLHPQEDHLSTWLPADLTSIGFRVEPDLHFHYTRAESRAAMYGAWNRDT